MFYLRGTDKQKSNLRVNSGRWKPNWFISNVLLHELGVKILASHERWTHAQTKLAASEQTSLMLDTELNSNSSLRSQCDSGRQSGKYLMCLRRFVSDRTCLNWAPFIIYRAANWCRNAWCTATHFPISQVT